jgi:hypothetical protein
MRIRADIAECFKTCNDHLNNDAFSMCLFWSRKFSNQHKTNFDALSDESNQEQLISLAKTFFEMGH